MTSLGETWLQFVPQASPRAEEDELAALVEAARRCAEAGAHRVWVSSSEPAALPTESLRLALFVALRCEALRVVAADLEVAHWVRFAEDVATADGLCGGRLELAFVSAPPVAVLASLRQAWSGAAVALGGGAPVQIHPRPARPDGPPLWTRVTSEGDARHAAEFDLGAIAHEAEVARAHAGAAGSSLPLAVVRPVDSLLADRSLSHAVSLSLRRARTAVV